MKLQHLGVVFIIIILPIALVISEYTNNNIQVLQKQADYNDILLSSTNDALRAFQMNTLNNGYSTINDSKIRDISASVNSFYNSLATALGSSGYSREDLLGYIPAMLFTMYDGYYLYGDYQNIVSINNHQQEYSTKNSNELETTNGVKPYIYYSCEYRGSGKLNIVVNYSLDNYITIMGTDNNGNIVNRSGYLINPDTVKNINDEYSTLEAQGVTIKPEQLGEYIEAIDTVKNVNQNGNIVGTKFAPTPVTYYNYAYYNNQKYYIDPITSDDYLSTLSSYNGIRIFRLNNNLRVYLNENEAKILATYLGYNSFNDINTQNYLDKSAFKYYKESKEFSEFVINIFKGQNIKVVTDSYNNQLNYTKTANGDTVPIHTRSDYNVNDIFKISKDNDPEAEDSVFNEHRMDVIISSIESNLMSIISNFNIHQNSGYEFALPVMTEEDWYRIANNISIVTFMQGMPIGNFKYYSNYAVVANTKNKEFVSRDSIILREKETGNRDIDVNGIYHNPRCEKINDENSNNLIGYNNIDYEQQTVAYDTTKEDYSIETTTLYYYPHTGSGAYECEIGKNEILFSLDNLMLDTGFKSINDAGSNKEGKKTGNNVRVAYITALAREKYNLYKVNSYFENYS